MQSEMMRIQSRAYQQSPVGKSQVFWFFPALRLPTPTSYQESKTAPYLPSPATGSRYEAPLVTSCGLGPVREGA